MDKAAHQLEVMLSPLARFNGPSIDEIAINRPGEAWVRRDGVFRRHDVGLDYFDCYDIAVLAGAINRQNVNEATPLLAAELPDGSRLQAVLPPCVPAETVSLTIRRHAPTVAPVEMVAKRYSLDRWNRWERRREARQEDYARLLAAYDSGDLERFLKETVRLRFNVLLCGPVGSGKTTMLNTMSSLIDPAERLISIENAMEIALPNHANVVRMLYSHGDQGAADIGQQDLLEASLRMRPDRILVGELRDGPAAYLYVNEILTGHGGSPSTLHGRTASQAAVRLANLYKASDAGRMQDDATILKQLAMTVDVIIPFAEDGGSYAIREVWLGPDAERRGVTFEELLQ